jgi:uncharacterized protein
MNDYSAAHDAVEAEDIDALREALLGGADVEEVDGGMSLLQHALDVEIAGLRADNYLHVDMTALILAAGADPLRVIGYHKRSALQMADDNGHWLAVALFEAWADRTSADTSSGE